MKELFELAISGFWKFVYFTSILYLILYFLVNGVSRIITRIFRTINILFRGWPPSHLDADGDFKNQ